MGRGILIILCSLLPFLSIGCQPPKQESAPPPGYLGVKKRVMDALDESKETGVPPGGMGFFPVDSQSLPAEVRKSAKSVFPIAVPSGALVKASKVFKDITLEGALALISSAQETEELGPVEKAILSYQISECIREKVKDCMIFETVYYGSAFVTGDGSELRTALHVVKDLAKDARAKKNLGPHALFILDQKGEILFNPNNLKAKIVTFYKGALDISDHEEKEVKNYNLDQVLIKLERSIAPGIPIATQKLNDFDPAYIAAAPIKTTGRAKYGAEDADGKSVTVSKGSALGPTRLLERLKKFGLSAKEKSIRQELVTGVALTADGAPKASGGAILNVEGQVVGIYVSGRPKSGNVFPFRVSYGTNALIMIP